VADVTRLHELQKTDSNSEKVRRRLLQLQKLLAEPEEVNAARAALAATTAQLHDWGARQKNAELEAQGLAQRVAATEQRLMSGTVRNPKELESLQASADALRRQRAGVEEQGVEALLQVEELTAQEARDRAAFAKVEQAWQARHGELQQEEAKLKRLAVQLRAHRAKLAEGLPADELALYEDLRKRKGGVAVATVENGLCTACNVRVPTGVASAARNRSEIAYCTSCGRILVA
jgi:predicted  nucleic acid-binding Zn-ribbon protein